MSDGVFFREDCLLKHYIRTEVWVPMGKKRLASIRKSAGRKQPRRLRYFTFCAVGALDVLALDRARVIRRSDTTKEFDTVTFFDRDPESVVETQKRIPGANGFPGDFVEILLTDFEGDGLESPSGAENSRQTRAVQKNKDQQEEFFRAFPFDVLNLDVEQYLYRPKEQLPGKLTLALKKLFDLQKRKRADSSNREYLVDEFTLMFTTQVGPKNLPDDYIAYLRDHCLQQNLTMYPELVPAFEAWSKGKSPADFFKDDFDAAFRLSVPKSLIELALECDWHIEAESGVEVFEFERDSQDGKYKMLHFAMTVRRQSPSERQRAPGQPRPSAATEETKIAVMKLFGSQTISVDNIIAADDTKDKMQKDLDDLFAHRNKIYNPA